MSNLREVIGVGIEKRLVSLAPIPTLAAVRHGMTEVFIDSGYSPQPNFIRSFKWNQYQLLSDDLRPPDYAALIQQFAP